MKSYKNKPGYILVFAMMMIALIVVLVTRIVDISSVHMRFSKTMIDREHAKILAWSGVNIAMSQLSIQEDKKEEAAKATKGAKEKKPKNKKLALSSVEGKVPQKSSGQWTEQEAKFFLKNILPLLNEWQTFEIKRDKYGINGTIKIFIDSEEGKIDLNRVFDFEKRKFFGQGKKEGDYQKILQEVFKGIQKAAKGKELFKKVQDYLTNKQKFDQILKNRQNRLYDTTEFFGMKDFDFPAESIFNQPPLEIKGGKKETVKNIYWTDIFTLWSGYKKINPWLLSNSIKRIAGLKFKDGQKLQEKKKKIEGVLKQFKLNLSWPGDWDKIFSSLYGIKYKALPDWAKQIMSTTFGPSVFSVVSYGTVGNITQKLFVVFERKKVASGKETAKKEAAKEIVIEFEIKKFYWI